MNSMPFIIAGYVKMRVSTSAVTDVLTTARPKKVAGLKQTATTQHDKLRSQRQRVSSQTEDGMFVFHAVCHQVMRMCHLSLRFPLTSKESLNSFESL